MDYAASIISGLVDFSRAAADCPDQRCLLSVMEKHGAGLVQMLWRVLGNQADVADAYQETFCRLAVLLHDGKSWSKKGFVYRMAANIAIDMLRHKKRNAAAEEKLGRVVRDQVDPASVVVHQDEVERLQAAIEELPDHLRQVLLLREFGELDYGAVASALGITAASARQFRHRAVLMLGEKLREARGR